MTQNSLKRKITHLTRKIEKLEDERDNHDCDHSRNCTFCILKSDEIQNARDARWDLESMLDDFSHSTLNAYGR